MAKIECFRRSLGSITSGSNTRVTKSLRTGESEVGRGGLRILRCRHWWSLDRVQVKFGRELCIESTSFDPSNRFKPHRVASTRRKRSCNVRRTEKPWWCNPCPTKFQAGNWRNWCNWCTGCHGGARGSQRSRGEFFFVAWICRMR